MAKSWKKRRKNKGITCEEEECLGESILVNYRYIQTSGVRFSIRYRGNGNWVVWSWAEAVRLFFEFHLFHFFVFSVSFPELWPVVDTTAEINLKKFEWKFDGKGNLRGETEIWQSDAPRLCPYCIHIWKSDNGQAMGLPRLACPVIICNLGNSIYHSDLLNVMENEMQVLTTWRHHSFVRIVSRVCIDRPGESFCSEWGELGEQFHSSLPSHL